MELYTIDPAANYEPSTMIDTYESLIWTERFIDAGEIEVNLPATKAGAKLLRPGTLLGLSTSREIMMITTRSIKGGKIKATGPTIEKAIFSGRRNGPLTLFDYPGVMLAGVVSNVLARRSGEQAVPGLRVGDIQQNRPGSSSFENIKSATNSYDSTLLPMAKKYSVGMAVYWTQLVSGGYELVFSTREGTDRTSDLDNEVIFSPDLDNLVNVEELLSDEGYVNVATAYPPQGVDIFATVPPVTKTLGDGPFTGLDRHAVEVNMDFITKASQVDGVTTAQKRANLQTMMADRAQSALKARKRHVDGELTAESQYVFYTDRNPDGKPTYRLGDIFYVKGNITDPVKGVMTEYIQSADPNGNKSYPAFTTLSEFVQSPDDVIVS